MSKLTQITDKIREAIGEMQHVGYLIPHADKEGVALVCELIEHMVAVSHRFYAKAEIDKPWRDDDKDDKQLTQTTWRMLWKRRSANDDVDDDPLGALIDGVMEKKARESCVGITRPLKRLH